MNQITNCNHMVNCIAHQDHSKGGRINVVETPDTLLFSNAGSFIPGTIESMIQSDAPPVVYRNRFLAQAMVHLNMIDTIGSGIKRMFKHQVERSFPLPDYELNDPGKVLVRLTGRILDENYTKMLLEHTNIDLMDAIALDRVQKKLPLSVEITKHLKEKGFIEGRRPNLFVSARMAVTEDDKVAYIKNKPFNDSYYKDIVLKYLREWDGVSRKTLDNLLVGKLSDAMSGRQKKTFITNLLQEMRHDGSIYAQGVTRWARWFISK